MTYPDHEIDAAIELLDSGMSKLAVSKLTGISRTSLRMWSSGRRPKRLRDAPLPTTCAVCRDEPEALPKGPYAYLLGLYLGDGDIAPARTGASRLRITCCSAYPDLTSECAMAMEEILPAGSGSSVESDAMKSARPLRIGSACSPNTVRVGSTSVPSSSPTGSGASWIGFLRPSSEGSSIRMAAASSIGSNNTAYPRYHFTNVSDDIRGMLGRACDLLGVDWRPNNRFDLSVARRDSVRILDQFIGPKH